jgi:hypothetical protein
MRLFDMTKVLPLSKTGRAIWLTITIILVPLIYFLLIGRYGWGDQDDGYMLGFAWRVHNGRLPYRDFIYILPPVSAFLHSIWFDLFPAKFLYAGTRLVALYEVWISSLLASFVLCRYCFPEDETLKKNWLGFAVGAFLLSVCGLTPMPWYTFDGIFFGLLGASILIARGGVTSSALAALFLMLSAGTKQSFYPLIVFSLLYLLLRKRVKDSFALAFSLSVFAGLLAFAMQRYGMLSDFRAMTSGSTHVGDAIQAGILAYLRGSWSFGLKLFLLTALVFVLCRVFKKQFRPEFFAVCYFLGIAFIFIHAWRIRSGYVTLAGAGFTQLLFMVALIYGFWRFLRRRDRRDETLGYLLLLGISWCASISMGFLTPVMFSAPFLVGGYMCLSEFAPDRKGRMLTVGALGLVAIVLLASIYPYGDLDGRLHDHRDLSSIDEHFSLIVSGEKTSEKLTEFKALRSQFAGRFVTLPAFDWSYIIANEENPVATDWAQNIQIGPREPLLEAQLDHGADYVFLDKSFSRPSGDRWGIPLISYVSGHWNLVYEGVWYKVYQNASLNAGEQGSTSPGSHR